MDFIADKFYLNDNTLDKHHKYKDKYKKNTLYWGLGIENEVYLKFEKKVVIKKEELINNRKRERYSVDYYKNYNEKLLIEALNFCVRSIDSSFIEIPLLLNSHSFTRTDMSNNSKTMYTKLCEPNPKFIGETLIETLQKKDPYFKNTIDNEWLFDGDTVEFNTLNFFNVKLNDVFTELCYNKHKFIKNLNKCFSELNIFKNHGNVEIMRKNYAFAKYMTNYNHNAMFNNGTLQYNITLPSMIDHNGNIKNREEFIKIHSKAIRMIQWLEPFLIAVYGTPDPFSLMKNYSNKHKFSNSSQRCAISRYIGIGTYDTDIMERGKILTKPLNELTCSHLDYWWFNVYYKDNAYTKLDEIGIDINFNKHYNHGIEIRFFEHMEDSNIYKSFEFIIYLMDFVLENEKDIENPIKNKIWNNLVLKMLVYGKDAILNNEEIWLYEKMFNMNFKENTIKNIFYEIFIKLKLMSNKYIEKNIDNLKNHEIIPIGKFSSLVMEKRLRKNNNNNIVIKKEEKKNEPKNLPNTPVVHKIENSKDKNDKNDKNDKHDKQDKHNCIIM